MTLSDELAGINSLFIDTAPIIYFIEAHRQFGPLSKEVVTAFQSGGFEAVSSVITLAEVLPKPIENGDEKLARKFSEFLKRGKNMRIIDITEGIAETAGRLRGKHAFLKTVDALQIAAAVASGADSFLTNDSKLKRLKEIRVLVLNDYLK